MLQPNSANALCGIYFKIYFFKIIYLFNRHQVLKGGVTQSEIFTDIYKRKGIMYFWKGFFPYYIRMAIHTMIAIYVVEELNYLYSKYIENKGGQWNIYALKYIYHRFLPKIYLKIETASDLYYLIAKLILYYIFCKLLCKMYDADSYLN